MILNADDFMFEIADGFAQNPQNIALRNKHFQTNINDNTTIIPLYPTLSMKSPLFKFVHRTTPPVTELFGLPLATEVAAAVRLTLTAKVAVVRPFPKIPWWSPALAWKISATPGGPGAMCRAAPVPWTWLWEG